MRKIVVHPNGLIAVQVAGFAYFSHQIFVMAVQVQSGGFSLSLDQINYLNIGLMLVSLGLAFFIPFELFLLAYAILGPLHYLTEISWLGDRQFFSPKKWDWIPLGILSLAITVSFLVSELPGLAGWLNSVGMKGVGKFFQDWSYAFTFAAFGIALVLVLLKDKWLRVFGLIFVLVATLMFFKGTHLTLVGNGPEEARKYYSNFYGNTWLKIFAVYMPTLIHVYLFTGAFILLGSLKAASKSGYASFIVFVGCALACLFFLPGTAYEVSAWARTNYEETFKMLSNFMLVDLKNIAWMEVVTSKVDIFGDPRSIMIARFIGFAYTYHYLNWFSKTSVIRWHEVPRNRFIAVIVLWVASVGLYFYNYEFGFKWLFLLSFAHVLLEFPLNHQSFIGIGKEIGKRFRK